MSELILVDDLLVDEATGEVIEWPAEAGIEGPQRVAYLIRQYDASAEGESLFKQKKQALSRALGDTLRAFDGALRTDAGRASWVAEGVTEKAHAASVKAAVDAELLDCDEAYEILVAAAKELDVKAVEAWINRRRADAEQDQAAEVASATHTLKMLNALQAILITKGQRSGYARVTPNTPKPPRIERRHQDDDPAPALAASIAAVNA